MWLSEIFFHNKRAKKTTDLIDLENEHHRVRDDSPEKGPLRGETLPQI